MSTGDAMYNGQPDNDQVLQDEATRMPAVPVRVEGPVRTAELPSRATGFHTVSLIAGAVATRIATADPRRKSIIIYPVTADIYLGSDQSQASVSSGALWPATAPLTLTTCDEIWAYTATATDVSIISEQWAL